MDKKILRTQMKEKRALLHTPARDHALARAFFSSPFAAEESFFLYLSVGAEADTREILKGLLGDKLVCVPRIAEGRMSAVPYIEEQERVFGIPQPVRGEDTPCRVALVPLLAVDGRGNRLGYGGGYYDRYFALHPHILRVGLAYAGQAVEALPAMPYDIPLQALITEEGVTDLRE